MDKYSYPTALQRCKFCLNFEHWIASFLFKNLTIVSLHPNLSAVPIRWHPTIWKWFKCWSPISLNIVSFSSSWSLILAEIPTISMFYLLPYCSILFKCFSRKVDYSNASSISFSAWNIRERSFLISFPFLNLCLSVTIV